MRQNVADAFDAFPPDARAGLMALREVILETATETPGVGPISEELRWGQPSYHTHQSKSGTPLRLGIPKSGGFALFVHCQTRLISEFQTFAGPEWRVEGTRAVLFSDIDQTRDPVIRDLIRRGLTYHQGRKTG